MPERLPIKDPRFPGKRHEPRYEKPLPPEESAEECAEKIKEIEALMTSFEAEHNLDALRQITEFASVDERRNSPRQAASAALTPIFTLLRHLEFQKEVSKELFMQLYDRYQILNRAVGTITSDPSGKVFERVVHDR